jgi:hypothetical protein
MTSTGLEPEQDANSELQLLGNLPRPGHQVFYVGPLSCK